MSNCSVVGNSGLFRLVPVSFWPVSVTFTILWSLCIFCQKFNAPGSSCIFPAPALESSISPNYPGSLHRGMIPRNQDLGGRRAHCSCSVIDPGPFQQKPTSIPVQIYLPHELILKTPTSSSTPRLPPIAHFHICISLAEKPDSRPH